MIHLLNTIIASDLFSHQVFVEIYLILLAISSFTKSGFNSATCEYIALFDIDNESIHIC